MLTKTATSAILLAIVLITGCSTHGIKQNSNASLPALNTLYQSIVMESKTRQRVSVTTLAEQLKDTDVIFMGEFHSHQGGHKLQLDLLEALYKQNPKIILSMEQFTRDAQPILDGYLEGKYGEATLIEEGNAWPHYKGSYRAIVEFAREHELPVVAANAPAMFVRCVGKKGVEILETIPDEKKPWSARKLDLDNEQYKAKFMSFLSGSGTRHGQTEEVAKKRMMNTFAAQLLRDTTMAESIDDAMQENPGYQVIHLNGSFHSDGHLGTAAVIETMRPSLVTSVLSPVTAQDAASPAATEEQYSQGDYIYLIKEMPERYVDKEKLNASIRKLIGERMKKKCEL